MYGIKPDKNTPEYASRAVQFHRNEYMFREWARSLGFVTMYLIHFLIVLNLFLIVVDPFKPQDNRQATYWKFSLLVLVMQVVITFFTKGI